MVASFAREIFPLSLAWEFKSSLYTPLQDMELRFHVLFRGAGFPAYNCSRWIPKQQHTASSAWPGDARGSCLSGCVRSLWHHPLLLIECCSSHVWNYYITVYFLIIFPIMLLIFCSCLLSWTLKVSLYICGRVPSPSLASLPLHFGPSDLQPRTNSCSPAVRDKEDRLSGEGQGWKWLDQSLEIKLFAPCFILLWQTSYG